MSPGLRAVVFDLDDTLYPERQFVAGGLIAAAEWAADRVQRAPEGIAREMQRMADTGRQGKTFDLWLEQNRLPPEWRDALIGAYRAHRPRLGMYPDAARALDRLQRRVKLGLVTEGDGQAQRAKVAALGLEEVFQVVVILGREEQGRWKPNPEPFARALAGLDVPGPEAAYVGDNPAKDFRGARALGMRTVRVRRSDGLHAEREPAEEADAPDAEIESLDELEIALGLAPEGVG